VDSAWTPDGGLRVSLAKAIEKLEERRRQVFVLYAVEGFTHAEIGEILGIPEGTSKAFLFEAKKELRRLLR
jgi:RNA polymerase sigma-70 factor (ECF subfamily)